MRDFLAHFLKISPLVFSLGGASCTLPSGKPSSRVSSPSPTETGGTETSTDPQAVRVDALAISFNDNLLAQGLTETQSSAISTSSRSEMSAISTNAIIISDNTAMALQTDAPTISELMGAMSRGATKAIAIDAVQAGDKDEKIVVAKAIMRAALSTIKANDEASASTDSLSSSLEEIVAEMTASLQLAGVTEEDAEEATTAISGEAIAQISLTGVPTGAISTVLPRIPSSMAKGISKAGFSDTAVPGIIGESTKVMVTRLKDINFTGSAVTTMASTFSDAAIKGAVSSTQGQKLLPDVAGAITVGTISSLNDHGFSKEEIRTASTTLTSTIVKSASKLTTDTTKLASIQDVAVTKAGVGLQRVGFSDAEVDLVATDLSSAAVQASALAQSQPTTPQVVIRKNPQIMWLGISTNGSTWSKVNLADSQICDSSSCKIPITSTDLAYRIAYVCETTINATAVPPSISDPYFFQNHNFDPIFPSKRVNVTMIYAKVVGTVSGQNPNCNDVTAPTSDPGATSPIYSGPSQPNLVPVKITVDDTATANTVCQIGITPFPCRQLSTIYLPAGKGVRILVGSGTGDLSQIASSGTAYLTNPSKVKLVTLDVVKDQSYTLDMAGALTPRAMPVMLSELTNDRPFTLASTANISSNGTTFAVSLGLTRQRINPTSTSLPVTVYTLPAAAINWGAFVTVTGAASTQVALTTGDTSKSAWKSQAFTKKVLPADSPAPLSVNMLQDSDGQVSLDPAANSLSALPLTWTSNLTSGSAPIRRLTMKQLTPAADILYTVIAPPNSVAANTNLIIPSALTTATGWDTTWTLSTAVSSLWTSSVAMPIGTDGMSYAMSSGKIASTVTLTQSNPCYGSYPTGVTASSATSIAQTLTDNGWTPTANWLYTSAATPTACRFTCPINKIWDSAACVVSSGGSSPQVRMAMSLPPTASDFNTQLFSTSGQLCSMPLSNLNQPIATYCYDATNGWAINSNIKDPRKTVSTTGSFVSGVPLYIQDVGGTLMSLYVENGSVYFTKQASSVWQIPAPLPPRYDAYNLQFAKLFQSGTGSSAIYYAVYAVNSQLYVVKSSSTGTITLWNSSTTSAASISTAWDATNKTIFVRYDTLISSTPTTRIVKVDDSGANFVTTEGTAAVGPIVYWNSDLYAVSISGALYKYTFDSNNHSWTPNSSQIPVAIPTTSIRTVLLDAFSNTILDLFYFAGESRMWKHSRVTAGSQNISPDAEEVAFAAYYDERFEKRPFVNTISSTRYFHFFDAGWKRVAFAAGGSVQGTLSTVMSPNVLITGSIKSIGLFTTAESLYRIDSIPPTDSQASQLRSSSLSTGSGASWSTDSSWNITSFAPGTGFGKFSSMTSSGVNYLAYLDCIPSGTAANLRLTVAKMTATISGIQSASIEPCPDSLEKTLLVTNPALPSAPNIFALKIKPAVTSTSNGTTTITSMPKLVALRYSLNVNSTPTLTAPLQVELSSLPNIPQLQLKEGIYANGRVHVLACDPIGQSYVGSWLNPVETYTSSITPRWTGFSPTTTGLIGCQSSTLAADGSGNVTLKFLDEPRASFDATKAYWTIISTPAFSPPTIAHTALRGGQIFLVGTDKYCKVMGQASQTGGRQALISQCLPKPTSSTSVPSISSKILESVDFDGWLPTNGVAVFNGKIHVLYPSMYVPDSYRYMSFTP